MLVECVGSLVSDQVISGLQEPIVSESLAVRVMRWLFASIIFSIIPIAVAYFTATPHLLSLKSPSVALISSVKPSLYGVLSTGSLFLVAASLAGGHGLP